MEDANTNDNRGPMPKFDGTGSAEFWLETIHTLLEEKEIDANHQAKRAALYLKGAASTWYQESGLWKRDELTWEAFRTRVIQRFAHKTPRHVIISEIGKMKMNKSEDVREFGGRIHSEASKAEPAIDEVDLCGMFLRALPAHYHTLDPAVEEGESQFEALVNECRRIQVLDVDSGSGGGGKHSGSDVSDKPDKVGNKRFNGECNYCKKKGHKEKDCRKKQADEGKGKGKASDDEVESNRPRTREANRKARWNPKTHERVEDKGEEGELKCWFCGELGHKKTDCPKLKKLNALLEEIDDEHDSEKASEVKLRTGKRLN